jgi:hypothetical protein
MKGSGHGLIEVLSQHFLEGLMKTTKKLVKMADVLAEIPEYESRALPLFQPVQFKHSISVHCILGHRIGDMKHTYCITCSIFY